MTEQQLQEIETSHYRMPVVLALIAEVRRLRERQEDDTVLLGTIAGERDAAIAERDRARVGSDRAESAARENADRAKHYYAALTEARRVLREVDKRVIQCSMCYAMIGGYRPEPHTPDCAIAAVLAQEEPHG